MVLPAVVLPALLYACETWTVCQRRAGGLDHFHLGCLGELLGIKWRGGVPGAGVLAGAGVQGMRAVYRLAQLGWAGRVVGVPDARLPGGGSVGSYRRESALKVARRNATKTPSKPL